MSPAAMACDLRSSFLFTQPIKFSKIPTISFYAQFLPCRCLASTSKSSSPIRRRRGKYGTSRKSINRKTYMQEQVEFTSPVPEDPVVGIIGGGVSGLMCASALQKHGIRCSIFDTGMHGLGGRLGTRISDNSGECLVFDHAAQFFTVSDLRFQKIVDEWIANGLIREWKGVIGELRESGIFTAFPSSSPTRYIGTNGMRSLADSLLSQSDIVDIVRPCWISKIEPFNGKWILSENENPRGSFDTIVIAHNGKCANRLLSTSGLPLLAKQMKKLDLSAIWALLAAFDEPLPMNPVFEGAFVKGIDALSWMSNNTAKFHLTPQPDKAAVESLSQCWSFFSTANYGRQTKVPQENIPNATAERVKRDMLKGVETALGSQFKPPFYTKLQLWGAALPTNTPSTPCIFDPRGRAGICGDWLTGSSVQEAVLSGVSLGDHIANYFKDGGGVTDEHEIGLHSIFQSIHGSEIGQFP